jgi:vancomycin resistance protein YoaR
MDHKKTRKLAKCLSLLAGILLAMMLVTVLALGLAARQFREGNTIAPNVFIQGVPVAGMQTSQAEQVILINRAARLPKETQLRYPSGSAKASPERLGARLLLKKAVAEAQRVGREGGLLSLVVTQVNLRRQGVNINVGTHVNPDVTETYLVDLAGQIQRPPRNADFKVLGEKVKVIPGESGRQLDVAASRARLVEALADPTLPAADLVVITQPPTIQESDLKHLEVVLATYSTRYRTWQQNRTHNLKLAVGNLSRAVVMPGASLSLNERIGPRLSERGYRAAPIFINGEIEPSTGGGVCQVATTVYNAALLAGLDILERHHHSRPVNYAPSGRDATVYWGVYDLRIRNNLQHPILLLGKIADGSLTVTILGSRADRHDVEIIRSGVASLSFGAKEVPDPELKPDERVVEKKGRNGARVTVTRIVKRGDKLVKQERLHTDVYAPQTEVIRVGPKAPEMPPEAPPDALTTPPPTPVPPSPPADGATPAPKPAANRSDLKPLTPSS